MKLDTLLELVTPYYGYGARLRFYLRLREYFRINKMKFLAQCLKGLLLYKYGCEISINAKVDPHTLFMHTVGVVIGEGCIVEGGVKIYSGVVLGRKDVNKEDDYPSIKKGAVLCTGSTVLGKITIAEGTIIASQSLVLRDTEPHSTYIGSPAKKLVKVKP